MAINKKKFRKLVLDSGKWYWNLNYIVSPEGETYHAAYRTSSYTSPVGLRYNYCSPASVRECIEKQILNLPPKKLSLSAMVTGGLYKHRTPFINRRTSLFLDYESDVYNYYSFEEKVAYVTYRDHKKFCFEQIFVSKTPFILLDFKRTKLLFPSTRPGEKKEQYHPGILANVLMVGYGRPIEVEIVSPNTWSGSFKRIDK